MLEFRMPSLGADMEDGTLTEWRIKEGDKVKRGDIVAEVETQKGLIEIEIFDGGVITKLLAKVGDKVKVGSVIAQLMAPGEKASDIQTPKQEATNNLSPKKKTFKVSPLARRYAQENRVDLTIVHGTGEDGAITKEDVERTLTSLKKPAENIALTATESIRKAVAAAMSKSNREIPHYYLESRIDMNKAMSWLTDTNKKRDVKDRLLPIVLLIKAVAKSLREIPELNATWENVLVKKESIHIGFVVSLRNGGVIVPAIHDADRKTLDEIMQSLNDIIPRARKMKLRSSELSDSTITITNIGDGGADKVFGVIYPPQVAIIGFGVITEQPFVESGKVEVHQSLIATLAGDHRATDGHTGSRFLSTLKAFLQKPEEL